MARLKGTPALSVDISYEDHEALRIIAKTNDQTVSQIIRNLVRKFLARQRAASPKRSVRNNLDSINPLTPETERHARIYKNPNAI